MIDYTMIVLLKIWMTFMIIWTVVYYPFSVTMWIVFMRKIKEYEVKEDFNRMI